MVTENSKQHSLPAERALADTLHRQRGISAIYLFWYSAGVFFDPVLGASPLLIPCCVLTLLASIASEYIAWRFAGAPVIPAYCGRVVVLVSTIRPLCLGCLIGLGFYTDGVDIIRLIGAMALIAFAIGAVLTDRPNLKAAHRSLVCYLVPAIAGGALHGSREAMALALVMAVFLVYGLRQTWIENRSYWALLHAERELRAAQQAKAASLQREALDLAQQAKSLAVASERSRIAAEWHDSLLADLSSATLQLERAQRRAGRGESPQEAIGMAIQCIRQCKAEARLLINDMFAGDTQSGDSLQVVLERELARVPAASGARLTLRCDGAGEAAALAPGETRQIVRICEEAVSNAVRHGRAREVAVELREEARSLELTVTDNGGGFDPAAAASPGHFGLDIMRSRARRLGGSIEISSRPGHGATVTLRLPRSGTTVNPIRVLVVDDHFMARLALKTLLQEEDTGLAVVGEAADCAEAIRLFEELLPDVTILDLRLPDGSGHGVLRQIHQRHQHAKVIVMSNLEGSEHIVRALNEGALGFLVKDSPAEEILEAIRAVHQGRQYLSRSATRTLDQRSSLDELSPREQDVIELLVRGLSNQAIADQLGIAEKTVRAHMTAIFSKLRVADRTQAAMLAVTRGLVDPALPVTARE
ncbi:MAG: hybrid sensor histidine kinase/response regulator transcription factor [Bryobacterales bacterium]|nr:hybrid sensor histidine kinase/response regulator transcription factor [Bryobacterales bacterium]